MWLNDTSFSYCEENSSHTCFVFFNVSDIREVKWTAEPSAQSSVSECDRSGELMNCTYEAIHVRGAVKRACRGQEITSIQRALRHTCFLSPLAHGTGRARHIVHQLMSLF